MTRLPWITLIVAAIAIFNPIGWSFVSAALRYSPTDWLRDLAVIVTLTGVAVLVVMGALEAWYRGRRLRTAAQRRNLGTET
jgi:hypothetical protein